jgi:hypothetical protein
MARWHARLRRQVWSLVGSAVLAACAPAHFTTLTIYETPQAFVRLEVDRTLGPTSGHSHPANLSTQQMASALRGIIVQEPLTRLPFYDDLSVPRRHPAFSEEEIEYWAPLLTVALSKATPEEVVTFYRSARISGTKREVTSGGIFLDGEELHIILSNLRSGTHHTADIGVTDTEDDRLTPMRSVAPQVGKLAFFPQAASRQAAPAGMSRVFHEDRRELIVLYKALQPDVPELKSDHQLDPETPPRHRP